MKTNRLSRSLFALALAAIFIATWSCNDDDGPSLEALREDRLKFIQDSLRISDSLRLTNNAGVVNYGITVVDASSSSIFANGRTDKTQSAVTGAIVTISQYGKIMKDTTDESGMVVFNGFFRSAVNVTVEAAGFTKVSYISGVHIQDSTRTGTISFVGNIIPVFATSGATTATISGRATIQTDLTNRTRELVPDGTAVTASIDATNNSDFSDKFLTTDIDDLIYESPCGCEFVYVGNILQATYQTGVSGTVTGGNYSLTVPAAIDGLPLNLQYSDVAADQTLFQLVGDDQNVVTNRVIFTNSSSAAALPASSNATVNFVSVGSNASASAVISANTGTIDRINVTSGGTGYITATPPLIEIVGGGGSGATATATVGANGRVTGITVTSPGSGYTAVPTVNIIAGSGATASAGLQANGTVVSVVITNSGSGYTAAPAVTFNPPGGTGTTALGTANIDAAGRVVSITISNPGSGYTGDPGALTIGAPPAGGVQATANAFYSGQSVGNVNVTGGANYTYAPTVTFSAPQRPGTRAIGTASFDPISRQVTGIQVTNAGSGYTAPPTVTLEAGSGASAQAFLTGGSVISFNITSPGADYAYAPRVIIGRTSSGNGTGAAGTAVMSQGRLVGINITNGGSGYTTAPSVELEVGSGAIAYAVVNANGAITGFNLVNGGSGYDGAPRIEISGSGSGATATATVSGGSVTALAVTNGGSSYESGNTPGTAEGFSTTKGNTLTSKPGLSYINDVYYGTGTVRNPN